MSPKPSVGAVNGCYSSKSTRLAPSLQPVASRVALRRSQVVKVEEPHRLLRLGESLVRYERRLFGSCPQHLLEVEPGAAERRGGRSAKRAAKGCASVSGRARGRGRQAGRDDSLVVHKLAVRGLQRPEVLHDRLAQQRLARHSRRQGGVVKDAGRGEAKEEGGLALAHCRRMPLHAAAAAAAAAAAIGSCTPRPLRLVTLA